MKAIVVGAGGTTRDLLRRLGDLWDVTVIDTDEERLARAVDVRTISVIHGDGSSRVILDQAGLGEGNRVRRVHYPTEGVASTEPSGAAARVSDQETGEGLHRR